MWVVVEAFGKEWWDDGLAGVHGPFDSHEEAKMYAQQLGILTYEIHQVEKREVSEGPFFKE